MRALEAQRAAPWNQALSRMLLGVVLVLGTLSPPVDHLADTNRSFHYAQHTVFMLAGVLVGSTLLNRRGWSSAAAHRALALGVLGLVFELTMVLRLADALADRNPTFHQTQHGVVFLGGVFLGQAIISLKQMRR